MSLAIPLAILALGGVIGPCILRLMGARGFLLLALLLAIVGFGYVFQPFLPITLPWVASLGITFSLAMTPLGQVFCILISLLATLILVYSAGYFRSDAPNLGGFICAFFGFTASMLGLVTADDVITLFVFWELTSLTSYLLIGFYHSKPESRASAQQAFLLTGAGGLAMLLGLLWVASIQGSTQLSRWAAVDAGDPQSLWALVLIFVGCATKSAQFPFHFWLPNAMAGPTPVSAFLHSATMVKAGVFFLAQLKPIFGSLPLWNPLLTTFGALTVGAALILMRYQADIKKLLAYSTVSALGMLVFLLGQSGDEAAKGFIALLFAHALYKGGLFMFAGYVEKVAGTRDPRRLGGMGHLVAAKWIGLGLAASGLGFVGTIGFQAKEYALLTAMQGWGFLVVLAFVIGSSIAIVQVAVRPFWVSGEAEGKLPGSPLLVGPGIVATLGIIFGLGISWFGPILLTPTVSALSIGQGQVSWVAFPGFSLALWLGMGLLAVGAIVGWYWKVVETQQFGLSDGWNAASSGLMAHAALPVRWVQTGRLRDYFFILFLLVSLVVWVGLRTALPQIQIETGLTPHLHEAMIVVLAITATFGALASQRRISAICMLGIVGTGIAILFLSFGAPDLALTQLLTELLIIVLAVLVFQRLPKFRSLSSPATRIRDAGLATVFGIGMGGVALAILSTPQDRTLATFYEQNSVPQAFGRNAVNTILVDFRALDTMGEITVLAVAALGVYALIHLRPHKTGGEA